MRAALRVLRPRCAVWAPRVIKTSVVQHGPRGAMAPLADLLDEFRLAMDASGELLARRREQAGRAVWEHASVEMVERLAKAPEVQELVARCGERVAAGELSVSQGAAATADAVLGQGLAGLQAVEQRGT